MKHFKAHTFSGENWSTVEVDADHISVNGSTSGVQFYRYGKGNSPKDELVAAVPGGTVVQLDETVTVLDAVLGDLSDTLLDKLAEALGLEELDDEQKARIVVTFTE